MGGHCKTLRLQPLDRGERRHLVLIAGQSHAGSSGGFVSAWGDMCRSRLESGKAALQRTWARMLKRQPLYLLRWPPGLQNKRWPVGGAPSWHPCRQCCSCNNEARPAPAAFRQPSVLLSKSWPISYSAHIHRILALYCTRRRGKHSPKRYVYTQGHQNASCHLAIAVVVMIH